MLLSVSALLGGCAIGPQYHRPPVDAPAAFRNASETNSPASLADAPWWSVFKDENLQGLIQTAMSNNYDLRIAIARVESARSVQIQARSALLPLVGYVAEADRGRNEFLELPTPNGGTIFNSYLGGFGAIWEVDLWGRIRRQNEAARAEFLASAEARRGVMLSLLSDVANAYFGLLELDERLAIAKRTEVSFRHTYQLFDDRHTNGLASKLEVSRARAALSSISASIPEIERQIALTEDGLNVLLGRNPGPIPRTARLLDEELPVEVPPGLPAQLLERRPDVRETEQELRAANAAIGVAMGDFLPKIGLTALYGGVSTDLSMLTSGAANTWSVAADVTGPIFQGGRLYGHYKEAQAARAQARLRFQETALQAFREVSDALVSRQKLEESRKEQADAVDAYRDAVQAAMDRYTAGKASYFEVLEAQQQLFPAENALSQIEYSQRLTIVQLYKALGGGWKLDNEEWSRTRKPGSH